MDVKHLAGTMSSKSSTVATILVVGENDYYTVLHIPFPRTLIVWKQNHFHKIQVVTQSFAPRYHFVFFFFVSIFWFISKAPIHIDLVKKIKVAGQRCILIWGFFFLVGFLGGGFVGLLLLTSFLGAMFSFFFKGFLVPWVLQFLLLCHLSCGSLLGIVVIFNSDWLKLPKNFISEKKLNWTPPLGSQFISVESSVLDEHSPWSGIWTNWFMWKIEKWIRICSASITFSKPGMGILVLIILFERKF